MEKLTDNSLMPFGKHKGVAMVNVPATYLMWLYEQSDFKKNSPIGVYVKDNLQALEQEKSKKLGNKKYGDK